MPSLSQSNSENENVDKDIVQLFVSDSEVETKMQKKMPTDQTREAWLQQPGRLTKGERPSRKNPQN